MIGRLVSSERSANFYEQDVPHVPVIRVECEASKCLVCSGSPIPMILVSNLGLEEDENEAIDKSNILKENRLRDAKPATSNKYNEGPDEIDVPEA
ncbi:hypothetical protein N7475_007734 [Penicillium sp. IBT 31633x]|nr:hypothetical protein N7475_007734 [Penicillium sp. IBT 31633x]